MNHAITLGGLLLTLGVIGGLVTAAFGLLMTFAGMMSDASDDGTSGKGCAVFVGGAAVLVGCILALVL